jgi:hypothetical protein
LDVSGVVTRGDFLNAVSELDNTTAETAYTGSLEEYLRALWQLLQSHEQDQPSYALFGQLLAKAFITEPAAFDSTWLAYQSPPEDFLLEPYQVADPFAVLRHLLLYQIADLRRMQEAGMLDNPGVFLGVTSPTGYSWYNFSPEGFLSCAARGSQDAGAMNPSATEPACTWTDLAILLYLGQIYE